MKLRVGTSGYAYKEWKGTFYPENLPAAGMLSHYAARLPAVEINATFYRMPRQGVLESWAEQVPDDFRFILKASRRITHFGRLEGVEEETDYLLRTVSASLRRKAGGLLFQLPPNFKRDDARLEAFLDLLPRGLRAAFEFRHPSWRDDGVHELLRDRGCALCVAETDEEPDPPVVSTASWGYLRLRRADYGEEELATWLRRIREEPWEEVYVFFKHEEGTGPRLAGRLLELAAGD